MLFRFFLDRTRFVYFRKNFQQWFYFKRFFFQPRIPIKIDEVAKNGLKSLADHFNPSSWNDNLMNNLS